jgi:hypothetical protein
MVGSSSKKKENALVPEGHFLGKYGALLLPPRSYFRL